MRKNKKLLLASVAAMGALALGVGATSTFAWFNATNASANAKAKSDTITVTNSFSFGNYAVSFDLAMTGTVDISQKSDGKTYVYTPGGLVEKTNASPVGTWTLSNLQWLTGSHDLDGDEVNETYVAPASDVIASMADQNLQVTLRATVTGQTVLLPHNAANSAAGATAVTDILTTDIVVKVYSSGTSLRFLEDTTYLDVNAEQSTATGKFAVRAFDTSTGGDYLPSEFTDYDTLVAERALVEGDLVSYDDHYYAVTGDIAEDTAWDSKGDTVSDALDAKVHTEDGIRVAKQG